MLGVNSTLSVRDDFIDAFSDANKMKDLVQAQAVLEDHSEIGVIKAVLAVATSIVEEWGKA
jgi:hypothetical protein